jgi:hypothetical protein
VKRISNNILFHAISSIYSTPNIFVKTRLIIFARSTEYLKFSSKNPLKLNERYFGIKRKESRCLNKRLRLKLFIFIKNRIYSTRKNKK